MKRRGGEGCRERRSCSKTDMLFHRIGGGKGKKKGGEGAPIRGELRLRIQRALPRKEEEGKKRRGKKRTPNTCKLAPTNRCGNREERNVPAIISSRPRSPRGKGKRGKEETPADALSQLFPSSIEPQRRGKRKERNQAGDGVFRPFLQFSGLGGKKKGGKREEGEEATR